MENVLVSGCNGRMGRVIIDQLEGHPTFQVSAGVDMQKSSDYPFPVYDSFDSVNSPCDIVIDFSHISLTPFVLSFCVAKGLPLILATTGIAGDLEKQVLTAAETIPIFKSFNMSLGISLLQSLVRQAAMVLGGRYELEIIEKHHNNKLDAPSGTALMIAEAAAQALPYTPAYVYDRTGAHQARAPHEIGIHAVRGGAIVGEHEAMFIGPNEILTISHSAQSRMLFADGALKAAEYLRGIKKPGIYNMDDLVAALSNRHVPA